MLWGNNQLEQQIPPAPNTKPQIYTSPEKLSSWSVEEVIKWIESLPLSEEQNFAWKPLIIKYFTQEEIDGEEFDLVTLKILKKKFKRAGLDDPELAAKIILEFRDASKRVKMMTQFLLMKKLIDLAKVDLVMYLKHYNIVQENSSQQNE